MCTYLYNRGFLAGNAVSADIIISTVPIWVYLLSVVPFFVPKNIKLIGRPKKVIMSLITFFGVSLIAISDASQYSEWLIGDMTTLLSAMFNSIYSVGLTTLITSNDFDF